MKEVDVGFTHVAFVVRDLDKSIDFYHRYAGMDVVHKREPDVPEARKVAWLSDRTRPFALVLVQPDVVTDTPLGNFGHLGVACASIEEIDQKVEMARSDGVLRKEPVQAGDPVGYFVFFADPDGNTLELSYGQRVGLQASGAESESSRSHASSSLLA
ncbi:VOC family protein [Lelliottia aquatilis]|nr:VOC family protein [Lelliottia aquatilis]NTZ44848.1 VOC family protein [Lelliottia aquatilis]